jgi:hypothetical protein
MQTTKIYRLPFLTVSLFRQLQASSIESRQVWNTCKDLHKQCRVSRSAWLTLTDLQKHTKGKFELQSQSIQLVCRAFIGNIDSTRENRKQGLKDIKYPWRDKRFYPQCCLTLSPRSAARSAGSSVGRCPPATPDGSSVNEMFWLEANPLLGGWECHNKNNSVTAVD